MNEFIEKLIGRLEELRWKTVFDAQCLFENSMVDKCVETVKELEKEYNNGWIPCSKKLPPKPENNMLFENKPLELYLATVKGSDYAWRVFWNGEYFTDGWNKVDVIAWQELPKVYKSKEGEL